MNLSIAQRESLARFAGLECKCEYSRDKQTRYWGSCPMHSNGGQPPDYDRDDVAVGLLPVLVSRSYYPELISKFDDKWDCVIWEREAVSEGHYESAFVCDGNGTYPTIHEAITSALIALIEEEK